jgi:hypothetical protein
MRIDTVSDPIRSLTQLLLCSANATVRRTQRRGGTTSKSSKALENRFFKTCRYYYPWFNQLCVIEDNKAYMIIFHHYTNFLIFVSSLVHQTLQSKKKYSGVQQPTPPTASTSIPILSDAKVSRHTKNDPSSMAGSMPHGQGTGGSPARQSGRSA